MIPRVQINDFTVGLVLEKDHETLNVTMLIGKPQGSDPIREDTVALIIEDCSGRLLRATGWPAPGLLPETYTRAATASAEFSFEAPNGTDFKRAIVVIRGTFDEIDLTGV
jgi:hypothetical protein